MLQITPNFLVIALLLSGCGRSEQDMATVCLSGTGGYADTGVAVELEEDQPVTFFVTSTGGCHTDELAVTCIATVKGDQIEVTTETTWVRTEPLAMSCESILLIVNGECSTPPLQAGNYTVTYDGKATDLAIPGTANRCL